MSETMKRFSTKATRLSLLVVAALAAVSPSITTGMQVKVIGNQLILSGPVLDGDLGRIQDAVARSPLVTTAILRDSRGGDIATGYQVGEWFRQKRLQTAVSGFCYSACSRMFLGGETRVFTDDAPPENTHVGFHGHYDQSGRLLRGAVERFGLKSWIIRYSDGKADEALVERWVNIPLGGGMIHFFHPGSLQRNGVSTFMCEGPNPPGKTVFQCEPIAKTALDLGVITSLDIISSDDFTTARAALPRSLTPSGYAAINDLDKLPLTSTPGRREYQRFLDAVSPRAFAIAPDRGSWAWNAGTASAAVMALIRCAERAGQTCSLYALDDDVVWIGR